ncbi:MULTISPECIES: hypothetical protein [Thermodesulfovibrio]|uniref:hypothetical protein n=1 Tax=Thermodesulfovibrio TaxID=28261 RepID=UPI00262D5C31|nr:hypothetical protein [Thermodesulfovibrio sp.]
MLKPRLKKTSSILILLLLLFFFKNAQAEHEFHLTNEISFTSNNVSGPGYQSSSLTEGFHYLNVLGITGMGKIKGFDYNLNLGVKSTDDRANDPKTHSLTNAQLRFTNKIHTLNIGDTFESFSQYTLSSAIKGGSYKYTDPSMKLPEVTLIYGAAYPRWDSLWRDKKTAVLERQAYGGRIKYNVSEEFWVGFNYIRSEDDKRRTASDTLYDNSLYSFDFEYRPLPGATISSELAFNSTRKSEQEGEPYKEYHGMAFKITAIGDKDPSRVTLEYERVEPDFETLLGSATADREKFKFKWRYKHTRDLIFNTGFLWYRNNLEGQKADGTTHYYKPEFGVTIKKLFGRQYASTDISYKLSRSHNKTSKTDHVVNLNYRDRFGQFDFDGNFGYTSYDTKGASRSKSYEFTYNGSLSSRHTLGDYILKPSLYLGGWSSRNELEDKSDIIYEYSLGLGFEIPKYNINSDLRFGMNKLEKDAGDDSQKAFGSFSIYYKPKFLEKLKYSMLYLRAYVNDYRFTTGSNNFRETSITFGINLEI